MNHIFTAATRHPGLRGQGDVMPKTSATSGGDARWTCLDLLTEGRAAFDLSVADLVVLRALLTFLPQGHFADNNGQMVVFPSNRSLATRAALMEERTLRRHLARLEVRGLVQRKLSPNRKRFACRAPGGQVIDAYGIDLAPLQALQPQIALAVNALREEQSLITFLKQRIRDRLFHLAEAGFPTEEDQAIRTMLRRKPVLSILRATLDALDLAAGAGATETAVTPEIAPDTPVKTTLLSGSDSHFVRHIQSSYKDTEDSEPPIPAKSQPKAAESENTLSLGRCVDALKEGLSFAGSTIRNWADLVDLSCQLAPMIGIPKDVLNGAIATMGHVKAAITVLAIIEMRDRVKKPGAYLRHLCTKAARHEFSVTKMIHAIEGRAQARMFPAGNA